MASLMGGIFGKKVLGSGIPSGSIVGKAVKSVVDPKKKKPAAPAPVVPATLNSTTGIVPMTSTLN